MTPQNELQNAQEQELRGERKEERERTRVTLNASQVRTRLGARGNIPALLRYV